MYISLYASTFNTKFNIQTQKGTWTTQTHIFTECNTLDHRLPEPLLNVDFVSFLGLFVSYFLFNSFFPLLSNSELILLTFL